MSKTLYPGANTTAQNFASKYVGSTMSPNVVVLHSTEGWDWPSYSGGATAPHFTIKPNFAKKTVEVRQHFPVNKSARALENRGGGVETNTLNAVQIELVGTCDPPTHKKRGTVSHIFMPEAPDWFIQGVADLLKWLHAEWPDFPLKDAAKRGWGAYPSSYGASRYRLSFTEWNNAYGVVGHQHVPENSHGDPGNFPIAKLIAASKAGTKPEPPVDPPPPVDLGPEVISTTLNAASYNATGARTYKGRVDRYVVRRLKYPVDVMNFQEVGNGINRASKPNCLMRSRLDTKFGAVYKRRAGDKGRYNYVNLLRVKHIKGGLITAARSTQFRSDDKQASWEVYEKDSIRAMDVSFHLENDEGAVADAKRVSSMLNIVAQALVIAKTYKVDVRNILFTGDTNSQGMVAAAMKVAHWRNAATGTEYENAHTFTDWNGRARERFDYAFVHETAGPATVSAVHRDTDISDHAELVIRRHLTRV
ncbi:hypothetical protein [Aeromicrobium sp. 9AM]|uniref:hypothetical protein n=1 Tax=Aeromicrobium sp. 9AM TaxID=2653126 RepID=UPI0012EFF258|nr:hypothetical protein [Aeromicrobium sp. 9AM]VXC09350.1 hypothetical protein AERO9AM_50033 [Aeromicrobium sp. 9AM]